jgi:hypothetical protein
MFKSITVDAKGNVYLVPQEVLEKHCTMIKAGKSTKVLSDWPNCYIWVNKDDSWVNCPKSIETIKELVAKRDALNKNVSNKKTGR